MSDPILFRSAPLLHKKAENILQQKGLVFLFFLFSIECFSQGQLLSLPSSASRRSTCTSLQRLGIFNVSTSFFASFHLSNVLLLSLSCLLLTLFIAVFAALFSLFLTLCFLHTFSSTFLCTPPFSSPIVKACPGCLRVFLSSILLLLFLFCSSQMSGGKYGNVSMTRRAISVDCVNKAGLSLLHQRNAYMCVCVCVCQRHDRWQYLSSDYLRMHERTVGVCARVGFWWHFLDVTCRQRSYCKVEQQWHKASVLSLHTPLLQPGLFFLPLCFMSELYPWTVFYSPVPLVPVSVHLLPATLMFNMTSALNIYNDNYFFNCSCSPDVPKDFTPE